MAERYTRLYSLPEDLYTPGAPLVIAAGALLKDNQTGQVLAQLKLRSISPKTITAVKLFVIGYDVSGEELCREEHQYLDLDIARDGLFGAKEAIPLPQHSVRSFTAQVLAVYFSDGSRYLGNVEPWESLPVQQDLNAKLFDTELIRQYRIETTDLSRYVPTEALDLWLCTCGEINHRGETCYRCGQSLEHATELLNVDLLRENKSLRLNAEAAQAAVDEQRRQNRSSRLKRILCVLLPLLLVAALAAGAYFFSAKRAEAYQQASALYAAGSYTEAARQFEKLGKYRDAAEMAMKAKKADAQTASYNMANRLLENARFDDAYEAFLDLGDYEDSAELAQEALYRKGELLLTEGRYEEAREVFGQLIDYRQSATILSHFFERLLSEEVSMNEECGGPLTTVYEYDAKGRVSRKIEKFSAYDKMEDRVSVYSYRPDESWTVTEGQVEKRYDVQGNYLGQGENTAYEYEYGFYEDGTLQYCIAYSVPGGDYRSSVAYDEHGNQTRVENEDGTKYNLQNEYEGDRLLRQERYDDYGTLLERTSFDYDDQGRLKRSNTLTPGTGTAVTTNYSYGLVYVPEANA